MPEEERAAFNAFAEPLIANLNPKGAMETQLAVTIATWQWRLNRTAAIEEGMFTLGQLDGVAENLQLDHPEVHNSLSNTKTYCRNPQNFERLSLYSHRLMAQSDRALKQLRQLQAERKSSEQKALDDAAILLRCHDMDGLPFDPAQNGFDFSAATLRTYTDRKIRLERAVVSAKLHFDKPLLPQWLQRAAA